MAKKNTRKNRIVPTKLSLSVVVALASIGSTPAWAFMIDSGNPDVEMRWDNSVRYNAGWRMENINPAYANAFNWDETENAKKTHDMVTNRVDLLTEFDLIYQQKYGFRVSAAAWSENAYGETTNRGTMDTLVAATYPALYGGYYPSAAPSNYGSGRIFNSYAKRYVTGGSGEILDAFVFGRFELGSTTLNVKAGKHNVYWGEAMFTAVDGISAGQGPLDTIKALGNPGSEAKELFMPLNQISAQWSLTDELSLMGQYLLDWKPFRTVPGGTYFAASDATDAQCANANIYGTCIPWLGDVIPEHKSGNFGIGARWNPAWLEGTAGLYYRKYDEKIPWSSMQLQGNNPKAPNSMGMRLSYARDTELLGISLGKNLGPVNTGFEFSYRRNSALNTVSGFFAGSQGYTGVTQVAPGVYSPNYFLTPAANIPLGQMPSYSQVEGARGNTYHAVANAIYLLPKTALWETGNWTAELAYQRLDKVTKNANVYYGEDYACKFGYLPAGITSGSRSDAGCSTKDSLAFSTMFTPKWLEVIAGMDLSMPIFLSYGLKGNSPTLGGSDKGAYSYSLGLTATYHTLYEFGLSYNDSHHDYKTVSGASAANYGMGTVVDALDPRGPLAVQNNHGWLSFHFKTIF